MVTTAGAAARLGARVTATAATPDPATKGHGKARAYGKYCHGQSKEHVKGEKGTAYGRFAVAAARLQEDKEEQDSELAGS